MLRSRTAGNCGAEVRVPWASKQASSQQGWSLTSISCCTPRRAASEPWASTLCTCMVGVTAVERRSDSPQLASWRLMGWDGAYGADV